MKLIEYIEETNKIAERFEELASAIREGRSDDTGELYRLFDAFDFRMSDIEMYRIRGIKDEDEIPESAGRLLRIDWSAYDERRTKFSQISPGVGDRKDDV